MVACPSCGRENTSDARFCSACGSPLEAVPAARKTVTILFSDVVGSTTLGERLDPEATRLAMSRYFEAMRAVIERHGGMVEKFAGDAVMAVFGIPQLHEDDALRAVRTAVAMQETAERVNDELERELRIRIASRTGVNTGEVVTGAGQTLATGDAVNVAARLEQAAPVGEILLGADTYAAVRDAVRAEPVGSLDLKGKSAPVEAWRLVELADEVPAFMQRIDAPFVGRGRELARLEQALERSVSERRCELTTIVGVPGIGKSRLARELVQHATKHRVVVGRCLSYGEGITFWPLVEIVRQLPSLEEVLVGDEEAELVAARVRGAIGAADAGGPAEETSWAFRRLFEALARERPQLVVVDDIHWAEPTLLDLLEYVVSFASDVPILLVCLARPDLLDERPTWIAPRSNATVLTLEALREDESEDLVERLATDLSDESRARVVEAAEGNPLFVEQLVAHQAESGNGELHVPATLQALLAARIDRLAPDERAVIERAAIEGRMFHRGAVTELLPEHQRSGVGSQLIALLRKEFIRPDTPLFPADDGFRFGHILIRDAAYDAVPKQLRAELHERYANWLEAQAGDRAGEYEEILGYHLERAYSYRGELGLADAELGGRAKERLRAAGERALARGDLHAAHDLLERALAIGPREPELLHAAALAHSGVGDLPGAETLLSEALATDDEPVRWRATVELIRLRTQTDTASIWADFATTASRADEARRALEAVGDDLGLAKAYLLLGDLHNWRMEFADFEEAATRAVKHARRAGAARDENEARAWVAMTLVYGPRPVTEAIARCEALLAEAPGRYSEGGALLALGALHFLAGETARGRELCTRGHDVFNDLGMRLWSAGSVNISAVAAAAGGDFETAERLFRWGIAELEEMGEHGWLPNACMYFARALCERGEYDEAETFWRRAATDLFEDDPWVETVGVGALARVRASRGQFEEALKLARRAVERAERTDMPLIRGDAWWDLAHVASQAKNSEEADDALRHALAIYEQKGMTAAASRTRELLTP
jgi:class 3 adenylate cyclase/tetratricopeptide (TPR) repeat protein